MICLLHLNMSRCVQMYAVVDVEEEVSFLFISGVDTPSSRKQSIYMEAVYDNTFL